MWTWQQSTGTLSRDGRGLWRGYAGNGAGKNNPAMQATPQVGPIPRGRWRIGMPHDSDTTGPFTMDLQPHAGTDTCGRSAFRIHGDSRSRPGEASRGCIILPPAVRRQIWNSDDHELEVVA